MLSQVDACRLNGCRILIQARQPSLCCPLHLFYIQRQYLDCNVSYWVLLVYIFRLFMFFWGMNLLRKGSRDTLWEWRAWLKWHESSGKTLFQAKPCTQTAKTRLFMSFLCHRASSWGVWFTRLPKKAVFYPNPVFCFFDILFYIQIPFYAFSIESFPSKTPFLPKRIQSVHLPDAFGPPLKY